MLQQNFKTATDLGLLEEERAALVLTLHYMETGKLKHVSLPHSYMPRDRDLSRSFLGQFNMLVWNEELSCGTVACIGGTAEALGGLNYGQLSGAASGLLLLKGRRELYDLFFPKADEDLSVEEAAGRLRNYLTFGNIEGEARG